MEAAAAAAQMVRLVGFRKWRVGREMEKNMWVSAAYGGRSNRLSA